MKRVPFVRVVAVLLLALALTLVIGGIAVANDNGDGPVYFETPWYLTPNPVAISADDGTTHTHNNNEMTRSGLVDEQNGIEQIGKVDGVTWTAWWYSEYAAQGDVAFPDETSWLAKIYYNYNDASYNGGTITGQGTLYAQVWAVAEEDGFMERLLAEGGTHTDKGVQQWSTCGWLSIECYDNGDTEQMVPDGYRLALRLSFVPDDPVNDDWILIFHGNEYCNSRLYGPVTTEDWPVPELPTVILVAAGLAGLGIFFWFKGRSTREKVKVLN